MKIETTMYEYPVYQVDVRVTDYVTNITVGSRTQIGGNGADSQDFSFHFKSIQELDTFLQPFLDAKKKLEKCVSQVSVPSDVPRARWKGAGMGDYECTNCWEISPSGNELDTCPHCGAYMK